MDVDWEIFQVEGLQDHTHVRVSGVICKYRWLMLAHSRGIDMVY